LNEGATVESRKDDRIQVFIAFRLLIINTMMLPAIRINPKRQRKARETLSVFINKFVFIFFQKINPKNMPTTDPINAPIPE
jgi:hypothetical protein